MNLTLNPTVITYLLNSVIAFGFALIVERYREISGKRLLVSLLITIGCWTLALSQQASVANLQFNTFWSKIGYLGVILAASIWLVFSLEYSQRLTHSRLRKIAWVWIIPIATALLALTNEWHHLFWSHITPTIGTGQHNLFTYTPGPVFWLGMLSVDLLVLASAILLIRTVLDYPNHYRLQIGELAIGSLLPILGNILYVVGDRPLAGLDLTPLGFTLASLFYWLSITRFKLFDIAPIAREAILAHLQDGVLVLDVENRIISINPAAQQLLHLEDSWVGKNLDEAPLKGTGLLQEPSQIDISTEVHWNDPPRDLEVGISPLKDRHGNLTGRLMVFRDITERKKTEAALRDSEALYHTLVETLPLAIFRKDRQGYYTFANQRYCLSLGRALTDIIGKTDQDLHPPDLAESYRAADQEIINDGKSFESVEQHHTGNGSNALVQVIKTPIYGAAGQILGVQGLLWDITEIKQAEDRVRASNQRLVSVMEIVPDGIMILDQNGIITFANQTAERLLGIKRSQIVGLPFNSSEWRILTVDGLPFSAKEQPFERVRITSQPVYGVEQIIQRKNGDQVFVSINAVPLNENGEEFQGMVEAIVDISEQKQAQQALARSAREMAALYESSLDINSQPDLPSLLSAIVERATNLLGAKIAGLYLVGQDEESLELVISHNLPEEFIGTSIRFGEGVAGRVAESGEPIMVEDYRLWDPKAPPFENLNLRRLLSVPLKRKSEVIGVINIADDHIAEIFTHDEIRLVSLFADQAAIAVENARLLKETSQHLDQLAMLNRIGVTITQGLEMENVMETLLDHCQQVAQVDFFYVSLYDLPNELITIPYYYENGAHSSGPSRDIHQDPGLTGEVIRSRQTIYIEDLLEAENPTPTGMLHPRAPEPRSYLGLPLILRDKVIGVLSIQSYLPSAYSTDQIRIFDMIAVQAAIAIENARLYAEVQRLSIVDELTGVYNYRGLLELGSREVERAHRFNRALCTFFFDIDNFRDFNNRYSHSVGNLVLRAVAQRSRGIVRAVDVVARFGGEEFVILLPEVNLSAAMQIAERLRSDIELNRVPTEHGELGVTISIGVATLNEETNDLNALIDRANQAEHIAKETGKNRVVVENN